LIKHKIAEMAIRAYAGEAILYRTLGMIDEALEQVDKDDSQQILRVLEEYAIECSIIKVWESEALAYVVDEEVQIFGGYGYSKEYPAERAYRDARIARIYEGTSEINRIVIGSQLLKRAAAGELPLLESVGRTASLARDAGDTLEMSIANAAFSHEVRMLAGAKEMTLEVIASATEAYGDRVREEQEVLGLIAEMVMDVFAFESAMLRTQRLIGESGGFTPSLNIPIDITRVFARDAAARIESAARTVLTEIGVDGKGAAAIEEMVSRSPIKTIAARRRIADSMIAAGKYNL
jgi:butyryl-CoA dehydrogenase